MQFMKTLLTGLVLAAVSVPARRPKRNDRRASRCREPRR
jgi:hypothetical protein